MKKTILILGFLVLLLLSSCSNKVEEQNLNGTCKGKSPSYYRNINSTYDSNIINYSCEDIRLAVELNCDECIKFIDTDLYYNYDENCKMIGNGFIKLNSTKFYTSKYLGKYYYDNCKQFSLNNSKKDNGKQMEVKKNE